MTKDFLSGLTVDQPHLVLGLSLINSGPEQWDIWKLAVCTRARKILGLGLDISQGPVVVIVTLSFAIISHILYRPVSHFLLLQPQKIYNLIRLLHSVTCINCKLYTCLNSSISLSYSILCYSCSIQSQCLQLGTNKISFTKKRTLHEHFVIHKGNMFKRICTFQEYIPS